MTRDPWLPDPAPTSRRHHCRRLAYSDQPAAHRVPFGGRFAMGFFGYLLLSVAWAGIAYAAKIRLDVSLTLWVAVTLGLLGYALYIRIRYRYSGVGYGIITAMFTATVLIVVGTVLLILSLVSGG